MRRTSKRHEVFGARPPCATPRRRRSRHVKGYGLLYKLLQNTIDGGWAIKATQHGRFTG